ncbi:MAG: hypothetical protein ACO3OV_00925 [Steroidobacteraceae bacterium]
MLVLVSLAVSALEAGRTPRLTDSFRLIRNVTNQAVVFTLLQRVVLFT